MMKTLTAGALALFLTLMTVPEAAAQPPPDAAPDARASLLLRGSLLLPEPASPSATAASMYFDENPVVEVARSTVYGAMAGTVLGLAASLVVGEGGEAVKWGFVIGTFGGFIWGLIYASDKGDSSALLETSGGGVRAAGLPTLRALPSSPGDFAGGIDLIRIRVGRD